MATIPELGDVGQSMWLDSIDRRMLVGDGLRSFIRMGISGVTSNPTIFQQAIAASAAYDDAILELSRTNPDMDIETIYEWLTVRDVQMAADLLRPVHEESGGRDGYVSLEVSPRLAHDTDATLLAARHLWQVVNRPNLMIKVPATVAGLPVVEQLIAEGINVNATLLFSVERYVAVAEAYLRGLSNCAKIDSVASVASFFVSRIDSKVDKILETIGKPAALALRGRIAIALARLAYDHYKAVMPFRLAGISGKPRPQRLLWASTGTKNPAYPDILYVDKLIGPDTVTTVPQETLEAFVDHGTIHSSLEGKLDRARLDLETLKGLGVSIETIVGELEEEGVAKFEASYVAALATLEEKRLFMKQSR